MAFQALAEAAEAHGCTHFAWVNADITVQPSAVARILSGRWQALAFCRMNFDPTTGA